MEKPDTITVTATRREEVEADKVDVHVTIKGLALFTGTAAFTKAKEIRQLVNGLAEFGVKESDIALKGIHAEASSGILGRTTSASYQIKIRCSNLEILADILSVVTTQKTSKLEFLDWHYPDDKKLAQQWLQSCLGDARDKAEAIASKLGVNLLGVSALGEKWLDSEVREQPALTELRAGNALQKAMRSERVDLGFTLSHSKWVEVQLEIQFRVSEFKLA